MTATTILDKPILETNMNAVIIHDDLERAARANAMLEKTSYWVGEIARWKVKPWRLDLLNLPPTADEALRDTVDARLIVFALRPAQSFPIWLLDWLEQWAAHRQIEEAALTLFSDERDDVPPAFALAELQRFAEHHRLNFTFQDGSSAQDESAVFARDLHAREVAMTPTLQQITNATVPQYWVGCESVYRHQNVHAVVMEMRG
jgi:hypothetical protein